MTESWGGPRAHFVTGEFPAQSRSIKAKILRGVVSFLVFLVLFEVGAHAFLALQSGKWVPVSQRWEAIEPNSFIRDNSNGQCRTYISQLKLHPYLGFVRDPEMSHCSPHFPVNDYGFLGEDNPPALNSKSHLDVLLLGGSVAAQLGAGGFLEEELSKACSAAPVDLQVIADGAWKQPQQLIAHALYGQAADIVVSVEGFNEHYSVDSSGDLSLPANSFGALQDRYSPATSAMVNVVQGIDTTVTSLPLTDGFAGLFLIALSTRAAIANSVSEESHRISSSLFPGQRPSAPVIGGRKNLWEYLDYLRSMVAITDARDQRLYIFLQPVPGIEKDLTEDELRFRASDSQLAVYRDMVSALLADPVVGGNVVDATGLFRGERETIYSDHIHFSITADGSSLGYELLSEKIVGHLATQDEYFRKFCSGW